MKDLAKRKEALAAEYRAAMKENLAMIAPHFPSLAEYKLAQAVWTNYKKRENEGNVIQKDASLVLYYIMDFQSVSDMDAEPEIVWLGIRRGVELPDTSHCLRQNGELSTITRMSDEYEDSVTTFANISNLDNLVLEYGPKFVFKNMQEMQKTIKSWQNARRMVGTLAAEFRIIK